MRSFGQLWKKIVADENLRAAWERVRRGHGNSQQVATFAASLEENLAQLRNDLVIGSYRPGAYRQFHIFDPKPRTISCAPVRDRVVHHALCGVITPLLEKSFSHASYACRVGFGSHKACQMARRYAGRYRYFCKLDIRHYFDSIDHKRLLAVLLPKFREQAVKDLVTRIVVHPVPGQPQGVGLPIGNLTSQWLANAFLDELDHLATAGFGNGDVAYLRYMDDFVFFSDSKAKCWEMHDAAKAWLKENRGLKLKEEATVVAPVTEGVPFLGLRIFPNCWRLKRERFLRSRRTYNRRERQFQTGAISERRFAQCAASSDGALQWFGFKNILNNSVSGTGADSGNNRIQRGGYFNNDNNNCRSSNRNNNNPSSRNNNMGFRLLSTPLCKGPARDAGASREAETNMQQVCWPVASANATPTYAIEKGVRTMCRLSLAFLLSLLSFVASADTVHLYECQSLDGAISTNAVRTLETGRRHLSSTAPSRSGWLFTHWTISTQQAFANRDVWGRAYDAVPVMLYEDTTLTAHYVPASRDSDGDGVADGRELYWYGDLSKNGASDTDGDGKTFAQELSAGTNPLLAQYDIEGPVKYADGALWQYNPLNKPAYTLRCEPEGSLFATKSEIVNAGTKIASGTYGTAKGFAYWKVNGVAQRDAWGRARDSITLTMSTNAVEIVAVVSTGDSDGDGIADNVERYWYGDLSKNGASDTDGDGKTFAQELAAGTNPLLPQYDIEGPVKYADGALWQYNPFSLQPYTLRSDPEGALFETTTAYVKQGTKVSSGTYGTANGFVCWKIDGVEQRDAWGRARDAITFAMPTNAVELVAVKVTGDSDGDGIADNVERYWYGDLDETGASDTDGDGKTFAQELAAGTNPLLPQYDVEGPVKYADSALAEMNLQPYEQPQGALVDGNYVQLFTSTFADNAATSYTFGEVKGEGGPCWPVVVDVNGDGLWDLIVVSETSTNVFVNVGTKGNPQFCRRDIPVASEVDLTMNSTAKLDTMALDIAPIAALSATTNGSTLLVSDEDGRIWLYVDAASCRVVDGTRQDAASTWALQHKVWGGSYAGFARGLRLAAVDWEDDGDLDCLCGTADGKLMLLRDPKVGRPTGLTAAAGVDNVKLTWDPNAQSRVRGYKVYRSSGEATSSSLQNKEVESSTSDGDVASPFALRASTSLPTYRDTGLAAGEYAYKVSALSRFYTAGNSTPTETESVATEPVFAKIGSASFFWNDAAVKQGERVEVMLSIENSLNYNVAGMSQTITFDPAYLTFVKVVKTGLTENLTITESCENGQLTVSIESGTLAAGSGKFLSFVFEAKKSGTTKVGDATVVIEEGSTDPTEVARYSLGDVNGDGKVNELDLRLLAKLKSAAGRKYTADQLRAGDFNGNGKLDNADYQALRARLMEH